MSRRYRQRQQARPWLNWEAPAEAEEDEEEEDSAPFFLSTGEPIDTRSAWQMPGKQEQG